MRKLLTLLVLLSAVALPAFAKDKYQPLPVRKDRKADKWAEKTLSKMTVEEKVGQLFMVWCRASFLNIESPEYWTSWMR